MAAFTGTLWIICTLLIPETYAPILLRRRAKKLSRMTGKVYMSKLDVDSPQQTIRQQFAIALLRPWKLLFREPIVMFASLYIAIVYGTLYLCFAAFPIVFQQGRGWSPGIGGLAFCGIAVGMMLAVSYSIYDNLRYARVAEAHGGAAPPEARLPQAIIGSVLLPVGLFWFAWTNSPGVHWIVSIIGAGVFAAGLVLVFLSLMNYLIDSCKCFSIPAPTQPTFFQTRHPHMLRITTNHRTLSWVGLYGTDVIYAASALAANSVLRSLFGAAFPLFTTQMYHNLGIHWASSVPAFLALACVPFPFLFWRYGDRIRHRCKFAAEAAAILEKMLAAVQAQQPSSGEGSGDSDGPGADAGDGNRDNEGGNGQGKKEQDDGSVRDGSVLRG